MLDGSSISPKNKSLSVQKDPQPCRISALVRETEGPPKADLSSYNEETESQRGDVICPRSHSAKEGLEAGRLAPLPPVPPLTASPFSPQGIGWAGPCSLPLQPTLTPSCCKAAAPRGAEFELGRAGPLDSGELKPR